LCDRSLSSLASALERDVAFANARQAIDEEVAANYEVGAEAALALYGDVHKIWSFERSWSLDKFTLKGDKLEVSPLDGAQHEKTDPTE